MNTNTKTQAPKLHPHQPCLSIHKSELLTSLEIDRDRETYIADLETNNAKLQESINRRDQAIAIIDKRVENMRSQASDAAKMLDSIINTAEAIITDPRCGRGSRIRSNAITIKQRARQAKEKLAA